MDNGLVFGFFDGVHMAHRAVIESAARYCDNVYILTFKESPALYFNKKPEYIMQRKDSVEKMELVGGKYPDKKFHVVEQDFSELAELSAQTYLENMVKTYQPKVISTGFNNTFGRNKEGNPEFLKNNESNYGYKYICTNPITDGNEIISSTLIKNYLKDGNIEKANLLLESNFILEGEVVHGAKLGRTIGYPTANINYPEVLVKIPFGVYKGIVTLPDNAEKLTAIINWGMKPTFNNTPEPVIEAHILNFDGDLYGKNIKTEILKQIRTEQKFNGTDELVTQIEKDIEECLKL